MVYDSNSVAKCLFSADGLPVPAKIVWSKSACAARRSRSGDPAGPALVVIPIENSSRAAFTTWFTNWSLWHVRLASASSTIPLASKAETVPGAMYPVSPTASDRPTGIRRIGNLTAIRGSLENATGPETYSIMPAVIPVKTFAWYPPKRDKNAGTGTAAPGLSKVKTSVSEVSSTLVSRDNTFGNPTLRNAATCPTRVTDLPNDSTVLPIRSGPNGAVTLTQPLNLPFVRKTQSPEDPESSNWVGSSVDNSTGGWPSWNETIVHNEGALGIPALTVPSAQLRYGLRFDVSLISNPKGK